MISYKTAKNYLTGVITKKAPMYVQFAIEKNCDLQCQMCNVVETRKNEKNMDLSQIAMLASKLDRIGVTMIVLTGGEPLLRKDICEIIRIFKMNKIDVRIQTNGNLLTKENLQKIINAGANEFTISLDSLREENQDFINQKKGSWEKALKAISALSEMLPKKGNITGINTVVSRLNLQEIPALIDFVTKIGFYISIIPVHAVSGKGFLLRNDNDQFAFHKNDFKVIDDIYKKILLMKKEGYHVHNSYRFLRESPDFLKYQKVSWPCDSPDLYFSISPSGNFLPCVDMRADFNILDDNFIQLYESGEIRKKIREQVEKCVGCMYACYPEITYFCRDYKVFVERAFQGIKISRFVRPSFSFDEVKQLASQSYQTYCN